MMEEFTRFHGMVSGPSTSTQCINSFDGKILFMPSDYANKGLPAYEVDHLDLFTYYGLVFWSLTGLSTILGATKFTAAEENVKRGLPSSEITPEIKSYVNCKRGCKVIRRFEYDFQVPSIHVSMYHLTDNTGKLSLVEIYDPATNLYNIYGSVALVIIFTVLCKTWRIWIKIIDAGSSLL